MQTEAKPNLRVPTATRRQAPPTARADDKVAGPGLRYAMVGLLVIGVVAATVFAVARQQVAAPAQVVAPTDPQGTPKADPVQLNRLLEAVKANPADFDSLMSLGDYYYQTNDYSAASAAYNRAAAIRPTDAGAQEDLGNAYFHSGDFGNAADTLQKVYAADPTNASVAVTLSLALIEQGGANRTDGLALWAKVKALPGLTDAVRQEVQSYIDTLVAHSSTAAPTP